jgi:cell division septation protein DedD
MLPGEQRVVDEIVVSLETRYPTDEEEPAETEGWRAFDYLPSRGIWVALATFIPTFLAIVIGIPHVLTPALVPLATEPRVPEAPLSATMASSTSVPRGMEDTGRLMTLVDEAHMPRPSLRTTELATSPEPAAVGPRAPKSAPAEDSAWTPAAAFADNRTAARLASTMRSQGYRVDVRHEDSATRPWVVWVKENAKPKGG